MKNTITLATFNQTTDAQPLVARLWESGIRAEIHDESKLERLWLVRKPLAGVRIEVHPDDFDKAARLVREWDATQHVLHNAVRCPECGSSRVEYPQFTRKFVTPNLVGLLSAMGLVEKEFYCQDCHNTWPPEGMKPPRVRKHMAPHYFIERLEPTPSQNQPQNQSRS
jgi:predicted Zn-ribbon and HTH transcriptional regulator